MKRILIGMIAGASVVRHRCNGGRSAGEALHQGAGRSSGPAITGPASTSAATSAIAGAATAPMAFSRDVERQVVSASTEGFRSGVACGNRVATLPIFGRANVNGVIGGGQAGYNWQSPELAGSVLKRTSRAATSVGTSTLCTAAGCPPPASVASHDAATSSTGSAPREAASACSATPNVLLYATGGLALWPVTQRRLRLRLTRCSLGAIRRAGWTAGAGAEWRDPSATGPSKLGYLYMDLGNVGGAGTAMTATTA